MSKLRDYEDDYPDWGDYKQVEMGVNVVNVQDIIGGSSTASKNYLDDWSPKPIEFDLRYKGVKENVVQYRMGQPKCWNDGVLDLGYIHLFQFYSDELSKSIYYVCMDGNRRVSICHQLKIEKIFAKVTLVVNRASLQTIQKRKFECPKCKEWFKAKISFIDWEKDAYCSNCDFLVVICYNPNLDEDLNLGNINYESISSDHAKKIEIFLGNHQLELEKIGRVKSLLPQIRSDFKKRMEDFENDKNRYT